MSMISELVEELIDNADLYTKELHDLMYRAADTIEMLSEKVREPKQGKWIMSDIQNKADTDNGNYQYICSECGHGDIHARIQEVPYCWHCGARMIGRYYSPKELRKLLKESEWFKAKKERSRR